MREICITLVLLLTGLISCAQKKGPIRVEQGAAPTIENTQQGWEALQDVAGEGKWAYKLLHDGQHVYVAVRIDDAMLQNYACRDGILLEFPAAVKKKKARGFVYPYPDKEVKRSVQQADFDPAKDYKSDWIARTRGYYVSGFPSIVDGLLSLQNTYGLKASAKMDKDAFYYVATIPKSLIPITDNGFALKLTINDDLAALLVGANRRGAPGQEALQGVRVPQAGGERQKSKTKTTTAVLLQEVLAEN